MPQYNTKDEVDKNVNIYRNMYEDTSKRFTTTIRLLSKWKGSVFKLMGHTFVTWLFFYSVLSCTYRNILIPHEDKRHRQMFELLCVYANRFLNLIPITFLVGFYVSQVVSRWWDQFMSLPWPDYLALKLVNFVPGHDHFNRNLRRTVMRYANLSILLVYRLVSDKVMKRFPDYESLVVAKLLLPHEVERLRKCDEATPHEITWTPILWATKLLTRARSEGKIKIEAPVFANLISSFKDIETANRKVLNYGWVNFPLAYTQVATFSVFLYFFAALFGRQYLIPDKENESHHMDPNVFKNLTIPFAVGGPFEHHTPDFYVPFFTMVEFICYFGWIKVAETLLNPFGDDDEDFKINYQIDRNLQVSYMIVDNADRDVGMATDPFLEAGIDIPKELPYQTPVPKRKFSLIGRKEQGLGGTSPATSLSSLAKASSNTMINFSHVKSLHKKIKPRRRSFAVSSKSLRITVPKYSPDKCSTAPVFEEKNEKSNQFVFSSCPNLTKRRASADAQTVFEQNLKNDVELGIPPKSPNILTKRKSTIKEETEEEVTHAEIELSCFTNEGFENRNP